MRKARGLALALFGKPEMNNDTFRKLATKISTTVGSPWAFLIALLTIIIWGLVGPLFNYSDSWQLVINTGTTIITFLMVFLIQNTQNREMRAVHLKLDELIRTDQQARNTLVNLENLSDEDMERLQVEFERLRQKHAELIEELGETVERLDDATELEES